MWVIGFGIPGLTDAERKVHTVIRNVLKTRRRSPRVLDICQKTGKSQIEVKNILASLAEKGYIQWNPKRPNNIKVIIYWDRSFRESDIDIRMWG